MTNLQAKSDILLGVKILEFASIGPVPWGVYQLVNMGAQVTRVLHPDSQADVAPMSQRLKDVGRHNVYLDLKTDSGQQQVRELIKTHAVLVEGMRPGVMENLGLSPGFCHGLNPKLVYVRVTGWGRYGTLADRAGHDINYIALSGALHAIGSFQGPPTIPLNLLADYGGGGAFMVIGVLSGLLKATMTGKGSVADVAMLDGVIQLMAPHFERLGRKEWIDQREANLLDGGAPWYSVYETRCGGFMAVGALEQKFYSEFLKGLGLEELDLPSRQEPKNWDSLRHLYSECFLRRTKSEWTEIFEPMDACVSPVLSMNEAMNHPHNIVRKIFLRANNQISLAAHPHFDMAVEASYDSEDGSCTL